MAKKYLSLERLEEYDALIKTKIDAGDASILSLTKSYTDTEVAKKANASHSHNDLYYTETEIDTKISAINTSITNITSGTTVVKKAEHADTADSATTATSATKATQDGNGKVISSTYETKSDASAKLTEAKSYADSAAATVKNDLLNGAGTAYDTLKELGDLIDDNKDAIEALETVASGKANATHSHAITDVTGLQSALDGKAAASHGTHVTFDSTNKPKMDGTAAFGTSTSVARADHVHPTDTSRASKTEFDTHVADTTKHITSIERTNWGAAYTHSQAAHAPSNAQPNQNAFSNVKVGTVTVAADTTTDTLEIAASTGISVAGDATNDKVTITNTGVIAVSTGSANGTISVNTNGTAADVAVKGLGSAAYTNSSAYAEAGHTHAVDSALSSSSTNPVQNKVVNSAIATATQAISANTNSINSHSTAISNLQTAVGEIQEITSAEIQSLFA